jgi:hypothetical protein
MTWLTLSTMPSRLLWEFNPPLRRRVEDEPSKEIPEVEEEVVVAGDEPESPNKATCPNALFSVKPRTAPVAPKSANRE